MENKKRALFIDRDGTLIVEPPVDFQVDSLQKLEFIPGVLRNMHCSGNIWMAVTTSKILS